MKTFFLNGITERPFSLLNPEMQLASCADLNRNLFSLFFFTPRQANFPQVCLYPCEEKRYFKSCLVFRKCAHAAHPCLYGRMR